MFHQMENMTRNNDLENDDLLDAFVYAVKGFSQIEKSRKLIFEAFNY